MRQPLLRSRENRYTGANRKRFILRTRIKDRVHYMEDDQYNMGKSYDYNQGGSSGNSLHDLISFHSPSTPNQAWNGGGPVSWNLKKAELTLKLKAENVWDIIERGDEELPEIPNEEEKIEEIMNHLNENNANMRNEKLQALHDLFDGNAINENVFS